MTHIKRQKLISSTQLRGYNTQFLLYPRPIFQDGGHRVGNVLPGPGLVAGSV